MKIRMGSALLTLGFEWVATQLPPELPRALACRAATAEQWMPLMEAFDSAPEAFDAPGQHLGPLLRAVLEGCAVASLAGGSNPLELISFSGVLSTARWDPLSRTIASARALSPHSPFHGARALLVGPRALGQFDGPIGFDGTWSSRSTSILQNVSPKLMTDAVSEIAREAERILLRDASSRGAGASERVDRGPRRL